ncbi:MAG TPA: STAS domain-containing protein, partial [Gemmatimonadales bacterium]|nr:STAS domain-containing protein [Gemmatimonadales bacterium]
MKIETIRAGGSALLHLEGRLDREWADHLSGALEELVQAGVRSLSLDFSKVTYASSAATRVLARWHQELTALRGEVTLVSVPPEVRESFAVAGYDSGVEAPPGHGSGMDDLRRSSWHARADLSAAGNYELSACSQAGTLTCHLHGDPDRLGRTPLAAPDCHPVALPERTFGLGHGAIGASHGECLERMGEFVAAAGCVAYFPTGGSRMADYLVGGGRLPPRATLTSGMTCEGDFSQLVRFGAQPDAQAVPLSELAAVGLEAAGGGIAGMVIAGETAGLCGVRLRKSPHPEPMRFDVPAVREWLAFAPERTY